MLTLAFLWYMVENISTAMELPLDVSPKHREMVVTEVVVDAGDNAVTRDGCRADHEITC